MQHRVIHIQMSHEPNCLGAKRGGFDAMQLQVRQKLLGGQFRAQAENDEVGFNGQHFCYVRLGSQSSAELLGAAVVVGQASHVVFQRVQARGGQIARCRIPPPITFRIRLVF